MKYKLIDCLSFISDDYTPISSRIKKNNNLNDIHTANRRLWAGRTLMGNDSLPINGHTKPIIPLKKLVEIKETYDAFWGSIEGRW